MNTIKHLPATITVEKTGDEPEASITITTPAVDLMDDIVDPLFMDTETYMRATRAVNFAHDHSRLPVGKTLTLTKTGKGIRARFQWLDLPDARLVRTAFEAGVLGASIEFRPLESEPNAHGGLTFSKSILTGWALTSNPANPQCVRMLKSLGVDLNDDVIDLDALDLDVGLTLDGRDLSHADVAALVREVVGDLAREQVRRVTVPSAQVDLDDEELKFSDAELAAAVREGVGAVVTEHVGRALRLARGRID